MWPANGSLNRTNDGPVHGKTDLRVYSFSGEIVSSSASTIKSRGGWSVAWLRT